MFPRRWFSGRWFFSRWFPPASAAVVAGFEYVLSDLSRVLHDAGVAVLGVDLFLGELPDDCAVSAVGLIELGGLPPQMETGGRVLFERPAVRVVVRGATPGAYDAAREKSWRAWSELRRIANRPIGANQTQYLSVEPSESPYYLDRDENGRPVFVFDVDAMKVPS